MAGQLKEAQRRNTIGKMEKLALDIDATMKKLKRPMTGQHQEGRGGKIEEKITLDDLNQIKEAFEK